MAADATKIENAAPVGSSAHLWRIWHNGSEPSHGGHLIKSVSVESEVEALVAQQAIETYRALQKAVKNARKNLIEIPLNKHQHIPHDVSIKVASSEVMIMPAPGRGLVAGSSVRTVLELGGVKDVTAKIFSRSKNKLNNARAAIAALKKLKA